MHRPCNTEEDSITRHDEPHMDRHFRYFMNTAEYERRFFAVTPRLEELRRLRNLYADFNKRNAGKPQKAAVEIEELIEIYITSGDDIFESFAKLLKQYRRRLSIHSYFLSVQEGMATKSFQGFQMDQWNPLTGKSRISEDWLMDSGISIT